MTISREKINVLLLASAQAFFQTASVLIASIAGLVGYMLAEDKSLATLPIAMAMISTAACMIPASFFMQRWGRKTGFVCGTLIGICSGLLGAFAIWQHSFILFVAGNMLNGCYQAFAQYYRFAAADAASPDFKSRAISWVIGAGVIAAVAGPNIASSTQGLSTIPFLASYLSLSGLALCALMIMPFLQLAPTSGQRKVEIKTPSKTTSDNMDAPISQAVEARPILEIMRQDIFITALLGSAIGFAMMAMVMTATPLAMQICGQGVAQSSSVIQWHVLGMFVPSFFTGKLIQKFGVLRIMASGATLLTLHVAIALSGTEYLYFLSGLILLGVGWNFLFIGGTNLLTQAYRPNEQAKTQSAHDFLMFAAISTAALSSGSLMHAFGWRTVNLVLLPFIVLIYGMLWRFHKINERKKVPALSEGDV